MYIPALSVARTYRRLVWPALLPQAVSEMRQLAWLVLRKNMFTSISPFNLNKVSTLTILDVGRNLLESVPAELGGLVRLVELYLNENSITSLPDELGQLVCLTKLRVDSNKLTEVPASLGRLIKLEVLRLDSNELTAVPGELGRLKLLKVFHLDHNKLAKIPKAFDRLVSLEELRLEYNCLQGRQGAVAHLRNLRVLKIGMQYNRSRAATRLVTEIYALQQFESGGFDASDSEAVAEGAGILLAMILLQLGNRCVAILGQAHDFV